MSSFLEKYGVITICILGSIVRFTYGYFYEPWKLAPDHIAWELILDQVSFSYDHLIHYPHEGGSILISLFSQFIKLFTSFSSLTIAAFILDFTIRYIQISVVKKVISTELAIIFGLWTIFAAPSIIPWATVNFGLHSISSVFPFILIYLLTQKKSSVSYHFFCGLFLGSAFWFSYSNVTLIPVFFLYSILTKQSLKNLGLSFIGLAFVLSAHLVVRNYADPGFHLQEFSPTSIRGEDFSLHEIKVWDRISSIPSVIANSAIALSKSNFSVSAIKLIYYTLCLLSIVGFYLASRKLHIKKVVYMASTIILVFLITYIFSPFYYSKDNGSYVEFRHVSYILPLVTLVILIGLSNFKYKVISALFILFGAFQSSQIFTFDKHSENEIIIKASGWVIAHKLGHDIPSCISIVVNYPDKSQILIEGIGWGTSTALMNKTDKLSESDQNSKVNELIEVFSNYPANFQSSLLKGMRFSFEPTVTPTLKTDLLKKIEEKLMKKIINNLKNTTSRF